MDLISLEKAKGALSRKRAWVGMDGFIDHIVKVVKTRQGAGEHFTSYTSIKSFSADIQAAEGKNLNLELYPKMHKVGGNGPLLAETLTRFGIATRYVGNLGIPMDSIFKDFAQQTSCVSLGEPGQTHALEFEDGKILLGYTHPLDQINTTNLEKRYPQKQWMEDWATSDVIAIQNWTMIYHLNDLLKETLRWLPSLPERNRLFFFDLADPSKRSREDLMELLQLLPQFRQRGKVVLACNHHEAQILASMYHLTLPELSLLKANNYRDFEVLRAKIGIDELVFHCRSVAVSVNEQQTVAVPALQAKRTTCLTGSGDHFNGGYLCGQLLNFNLAQSLLLGHISSVFYIENGHSSSLEEAWQILNLKQEE